MKQIHSERPVQQCVEVTQVQDRRSALIRRHPFHLGRSAYRFICAIVNALDFDIFQDLRVVESHKRQHGYVPEGMGDIENHLVPELELIIHGLKNLPEFLLTLTVRYPNGFRRNRKIEIFQSGLQTFPYHSLSIEFRSVVHPMLATRQVRCQYKNAIFRRP